MNVILFVGSGISLDSGLYGVPKLNSKILEGDSRESLFLNELKKIDERYRGMGGLSRTVDGFESSGEIYHTETSYEDLFFLCDELGFFSYGLHSNSLTACFAESLVYEMIHFEGTSTEQKLMEVGRLSLSSKLHIERIVQCALKTPSEIRGLDLIVELANDARITTLNIVTLNHDLLVEMMLMKNSIQYQDGFAEPDGDIRWFNPDSLFTDQKVRLIKLHGSIGWYNFLVDGQEKLGSVVPRETGDYRNGAGNVVPLSRNIPMVLSGQNKIHLYNRGTYHEMHFHFHRILYETETLLMSGYGWGDQPLNNRIESWLDKRPENKLVLMHQNPKTLMSRCLFMDSALTNFIAIKKIRPIYNWLSEVTVSDLMQVL